MIVIRRCWLPSDKNSCLLCQATATLQTNTSLAARLPIRAAPTTSPASSAHQTIVKANQPTPFNCFFTASASTRLTGTLAVKAACRARTLTLRRRQLLVIPLSATIDSARVAQSTLLMLTTRCKPRTTSKSWSRSLLASKMAA